MRRKAVYNKATALEQWWSRPLTFAVVMASMMLPIASVHAGQNLIVNGSFELDTWPCRGGHFRLAHTPA